jgi:hypothetical protein
MRPNTWEVSEQRRAIGRGGDGGKGPGHGNPSQQTAPRTLGRDGALSALERVRDAAERDKQVRFTALLHHVYIELPETVNLGAWVVDRSGGTLRRRSLATAGARQSCWRRWSRSVAPAYSVRKRPRLWRTGTTRSTKSSTVPGV